MDQNQKIIGKMISIDGSIGAGKSTVLKNLRRLGYYVFPENIESWGSFLHNQLKKIKKLCETNKYIFLDRALEWSMIFANISYLKGDKNEEEFNLYKDCFAKLVWKPDIRLFFNTDVSMCMERIKEQRRDCERNIDCQYLTAI